MAKNWINWSSFGATLQDLKEKFDKKNFLGDFPYTKTPF
jgi:hypothetical protein